MTHNTSNTHILKQFAGYGHAKITITLNNGIGEILSKVTDNMRLIDNAFNSDEGDTSYYDSVDEARQAAIDFVLSAHDIDND